MTKLINLSTPLRPVHLLARSQSITFHVSSTRVFPYVGVRLPHFSLYMLFVSPHHMPVPVQSSLVALFGACATPVIPRIPVFLSLRIIPHIHRRILISFKSVFTITALNCRPHFCRSHVASLVLLPCCRPFPSGLLASFCRKLFHCSSSDRS